MKYTLTLISILSFAAYDANAAGGRRWDVSNFYVTDPAEGPKEDLKWSTQREVNDTFRDYASINKASRGCLKRVKEVEELILQNTNSKILFSECTIYTQGTRWSPSFRFEGLIYSL